MSRLRFPLINGGTMANCGEVEREMSALVERRRAQTSAGREAYAKTFDSDEMRRAHMRDLAKRSAAARRQARLDRLRAEAEAILERRRAS